VRRRLFALVALRALGAVAAAGCSGRELPGDQELVSAHFRYHARAETVLDPTITDRLERHRDDVDARFGVDGGIVDYYLFRDYQDLHATTGIDRTGYTLGRSVYTSEPFSEHELVHALLAEAGPPSSMALSEGVAQWSACLDRHNARPVPPSAWPAVFGAQHGNPTVYDFGQRLVAWIVESSDVGTLMAFYAHDVVTDDPAVFDDRFAARFSRRIEDVLPELAAPRFARGSCACGAPALADGETFVAGQEYRVIDVAEESRLELTGATGVVVVPGPCEGADDVTPWSSLPHPDPMAILARVAAGKHAVAALPGETGPATITKQRQEPFGDASCEAAAARAPLALGQGALALWVDHRFAATKTWFPVTLGGPLHVALSPGAALVACRTCSGPALCQSFQDNEFEAPLAVPPGGGLLLGLSGASDRDIAARLSVPQ
jgi:hypothetical protein